ncbi:MAG: DUF1009 domain-containing protein [Bauldia sp.]|nr:MAG: DUF1009 domain-containing protein [Bauldia sp.]
MPTKGSDPLTIIAGGGSVPVYVARAAARLGRPVQIVGLVGEAERGIEEFPHEWLKWGEIGRLESILAAHGTRDIVLVGGIHSRPDFSTVKVDFGTLRVLPEVLKLLAAGDSDLLSGVVQMLAKRGYRVVGAHEVAGDLVAGPGPIGGRTADRGAKRDVERAMRAAQAIGAIDAGQAAVAVNGRIVALEAAEGTDGMLERVAALRAAGRLKWNGRAGVLAKCAKPQQDLRVDMPTIGPRTVEAAARIGLAGIAIETGRVMIVDREEVVRRADAEGIFVTGEAPLAESGA